MKANDISYPHPVIGNGDDMNGAYVPSFNCNLSKEKVSLQVMHKLASPTLEEMIADGRASFCTEAQCPQTFYRKSFLSPDPRQEILINSSELKDRVGVRFYIVSLTSGVYSPKEANTQYSGFDFKIKKGDILGFGGSAWFPVEKTWERANSISPILIIMPNDKVKSRFDVQLDSDKIIIYLSVEDYRKYKSAKQYAPIFHSSIVVPALMQALAEVATETTRYKTKLWHERLTWILDNNPELKKLAAAENALEIAQTILHHPFGRTLDLLLDYPSQS